MASDSDPTQQLRSLARRVADVYLAHSGPRAVLLVGSAATGNVDEYSDLDLILYYDGPASHEALAAARRELAAERFQGRADPEDRGYGERYYLGKLQCQLAHVTVESFEREIEKLVVDLELNQELPKIMSGLFEGLPLHGEALIEKWRRKAGFNERLQRAMIEKHWKFFPWWHFQERLRTRDATVWRYDVLVQSAYNIVGVLAALNGLYFSTFEFKRAGAFLARFELAPENLAARIESLFELDEPEATAEVERLVSETGALVADRFSDIDLSLEWGGNPTPPGSREIPWREIG
jgi:predicted nucleotidyltransferase